MSSNNGINCDRKKPAESLSILKRFKVFNTFDDIFLKSIKYFCVPLKNEAYVVDRDSKVYYIINNFKYELEILSGKGVQEFAYSYFTDGDRFSYHIMALTKNGRVFGWGENSFKQVTTKRGEHIYFPVRLDFDYGYFTVYRSYCAQKLLEISETVIFNKEDSECCNSWAAQLENRVRFRLIACGQSHFMGVTRKDEIIVWGNNQLGQMGIGKTSKIEKPYKILIKKEKIVEFNNNETESDCNQYISLPLCAVLMTIAMTLLKALYYPFICILTCFMRVQPSPKFIYEESNSKRESNIRAIACGANHNLVLFQNGHLWGWGNNDCGQLGQCSNEPFIQPKPLFEQVKSIATINDHTLVLCWAENGSTTLYGMGDNDYGQLGTLDSRECFIPLTINGNFEDIATINGISMGLTIVDNVNISSVEVSVWGLYSIQKVKEKDSDVRPNLKRLKLINGPKRVNGCVHSLNEFIAIHFSITRATIEIDESTLDNDLKVFEEVVLIDEDELINIDLPKQKRDTKSNSGDTYIHYGDQYKSSIFEDSNIVVSKGNFKVKGVKQKQTGFKKVFSKNN